MPKTAGNAKTVWAWAGYDFANSPFSTLTVTFIYSTYFTQALAPDPITGTALWSRGVVVTALVVALLAPPLGALADRGGYRKALLLGFTAVCILACVALYPIRPGHALLALGVFVLANVAFELANVFYNAFLPDIAPAGRIGRVSGAFRSSAIERLPALTLTKIGEKPASPMSLSAMIERP